jgi:hypothetical protein
MNPHATDPPALLGYSHAPADARSTRPRPKWVCWVVGIYGLCLGALLVAPAVTALFGLELGAVAVESGYVVALVLCGLGMVLVPVRNKQRRPINRRSVWITVLASGFLFALLVGGAAMAIGEYAKCDLSGTVLTIATACVWGAWTILFGLVGRAAEPITFAGKLYKLVLAGSVLELLVAVPMHVVVRKRPDCCAGLETGIGICVGVTVMIVAFGPAVLVLYWKRWKRISPLPGREREH